MDKTEKSMDSSVAQQSFFNLIKDSSQSPDEGRSLAKHSLDTIMHQDHRRPELYCSDSHTEVSSTDHSEEVVSAVQKNSDKCPEISDCSTPCTQLSSSISALSPVAALVPPTQQVQERILPGKKAPTSIPNDSPSIGCQVIDYASEKDRRNSYSFTVSQEDSYHALLDEDSCDASLSSPISALSPVAALVPPTQQVQEQILPGKKAPTSIPNDSPSIGCQVIDYASEKDRRNSYSFTVSQEDSYHALLDEDSCDASYLQSVSDSAVAFNQQYREKRSEEESSVVAEPFSPEAFFSSIPLFKKLQKKPATILPKLYTTDSPSFYQYEQADQCFSKDDHGVIMSNSKPSSTLVMHGSNQGVPIAPKPDPNTKVSCYVLVVPAPLYYENCTPQDSLQIQQEHQEDSPTDAHFALANIGATPKALHLPRQTLTYPPEWTPQPQKPARTSLPSTRIRVSPSPNKSSRYSPIITVSTTSTPIQPLQGNRQQYVIVQGNNRHLKGIARYKDSFRTPTVEENHQPIYLQGLPPQGFRRFLKSKEGSCTERPTKRSLAPLFSKVSPSDGQEATVPQAEKSPLTCIRSKLPCDREVPETDSAGGSDSKCLANENTNTSTLTPTVEETGTQIITASKVQECHREDELELPVNFKSDKSDQITTTPTPKTRHGEDREKKKIRDRRYDAELKKAFDQLRQLVPRLQKSSSRGLILQETIKYIGILEKKVLGAGLWSTLQSVETAERNTQSKSPAQATIVEKGVSEKPSPAISCDVTDTYSNVVTETEKEPLALTSEQEKSKTVLNSPVILIPPMSLSTEKLSYSFVSHEGSVVTNYSVDTNEEGVTVEEVPLSIPFQQVQLLAAGQSDKTPVLTARSPDEPLSKEPHTRLIPVVEIPGYTESSEYLNVTDEDHKSPQWDVFLSAMTTISQEGLNDLGVTLSPLLSPLGILLSPGEDRSQGSSITAEVECEESTEAEAILNSAIEDYSFACSGGMSGICTDMTSIAASVEITTEERDKSAHLSTSNTRRKSRLSQVVPSLSPPQVSDDGLTCRTHRSRNRAILQDHSNFTDAKSSVDGGGKGRQRRLKDHLLRQSSNANADENSAIVANQSRTPPGRVSGVLLKGKRKTARSPRGGVGMKRGRRI